MEIKLKPGKYVVAVSGGVDSVVLLHLLAKSPELRVQRQGGKSSQLSALSFELIVAHYDHGIREDSGEDRRLVAQLAEGYGLRFVSEEGKLGPEVSEAVARKARYDFLRRVQKEHGADAIMTAHHQDDLLETAILNLLRGTGRKGLSSLQSGGDMVRPLLGVPKAELIAYALKNRLEWREDSTNQDVKYRRNYVRQHIVPKMSAVKRAELLKVLANAKKTNDTLDKQIEHILSIVGGSTKIDRKFFISLPHTVSLEVMAAWLRKNEIRQFDKKTLQRLVEAAKTYRLGKKVDINADASLFITSTHLTMVQKNEN